MAEDTGFEPADPCGSPVFKTGALSQTQPILRTRWGTRTLTNKHCVLSTAWLPLHQPSLLANYTRVELVFLPWQGSVVTVTLIVLGCWRWNRTTLPALINGFLASILRDFPLQVLVWSDKFHTIITGISYSYPWPAYNRREVDSNHHTFTVEALAGLWTTIIPSLQRTEARNKTN